MMSLDDESGVNKGIQRCRICNKEITKGYEIRLFNTEKPIGLVHSKKCIRDYYKIKEVKESHKPVILYPVNFE